MPGMQEAGGQLVWLPTNASSSWAANLPLAPLMTLCLFEYVSVCVCVTGTNNRQNEGRHVLATLNSSMQWNQFA